MCCERCAPIEISIQGVVVDPAAMAAAIKRALPETTRFYGLKPESDGE